MPPLIGKLLLIAMLLLVPDVKARQGAVWPGQAVSTSMMESPVADQGDHPEIAGFWPGLLIRSVGSCVRYIEPLYCVHAWAGIAIAPSIKGAVAQVPGPPETVMGAAAVPEFRNRKVSFHIPPHARYTVSPGAKVAIASLPSVCHGPVVAPATTAAVPSKVSLPPLELT